MTPEQQTELRRRWDANPYSYRELFDGEHAVKVLDVISHLRKRGLGEAGAVGWLATMVQVGRLQMISSDLVELGPRAEPLPEWL